MSDRLSKIQEQLSQVDTSNSVFIDPKELPAKETGSIVPAASGKQGRLNKLKSQVEQLEVKDTLVPSTGQLSFMDRINLSIIRDPANQEKFLQSRGLSSNTFDKQDSNEGIMGISIGDLADIVDLIFSSLATGAGAAGGALGGASAGLLSGPAAPVLSPALAAGGAVAGGAAAGALYDEARSTIAQALAESNIDDSDAAVEMLSGALGPIAGPAVKALAKGSSKAIPTVAKNISKMNKAAKNTTAGGIALITGADKAAVQAFMDEPLKALSLAGTVKKSPGKMVQLGEDVTSELIKADRALNARYAEGIKDLRPRLQTLKFKNTADEVVEGAGEFIDAAGNPIPTTVTKPGKLAQEAADFLGMDSAESFIQAKSKEATKTLSREQISRIPPVVLEVARKPELNFRDVEALRKARNSLFEQVAKGKEEAKAGLALTQKLLSAVDEMPVAGDLDAFQAFRRVNKTYKEAADLLDPITEELTTFKKSLKTAQAATDSSDIVKQGVISNMRDKMAKLQDGFLPDVELTKKFDTLSGVLAAQRLFKKGAFPRTSQAGMTGAFVGSQLGDSTGSLIGLGMGTAAGLAGQAPGLGVLGGAAMGLASPVGSGISKELINQTSIRERLGPSLGRMPEE